MKKRSNSSFKLFTVYGGILISIGLVASGIFYVLNAEKTDASRDPIKTLEFFIVQDNAVGIPSWTVGGGTQKNYDVFIAEYDGVPNTAQVRHRNAYVEISGMAVASSAFQIRVNVNSQGAITYNMPSTSGNAQYFSVIYQVNSLNYDYPTDQTATNTLEIDFPVGQQPTSVSLLGAKQVFTYSINTAV